MSGTPNYLKAGNINRSTRSREIVDYLDQDVFNFEKKKNVRIQNVHSFAKYVLWIVNYIMKLTKSALDRAKHFYMSYVPVKQLMTKLYHQYGMTMPQY